MATIRRDGVEIHYQDIGQGQPIILGHSFLCSGEMWGPQLGPLSEKFRVINVDFRGHGKSGHAESPFTLYDLVDDLLAVLDSLELDTAIWGGLSIGGMVALRAALSAKERVSGLMLLDTSAESETLWKRIKYRIMAMSARLVGLARLAPTIEPIMFGRATRRDKKALVLEWRKRWSSLHLPSIVQGIHALTLRDSVLGSLHRIDVPTLVLVGKDDKGLPPALSRRIHKGIESSTLVEIPDCGHLSTLEHPNQVNKAILDFLKKHFS